MTSLAPQPTYIPTGYKLSHKMRVSPPMSERPSEVRLISQREGKPPSKSTAEAAAMWEKIEEFVKRHNALPNRESGDEDQIKMHEFLMTSPTPDTMPRRYYISQDGVADWKPFYGEVAGTVASKGIRGYVNNYTGQTIMAAKNTVQPTPIYYNCLVSSAEVATHVKPHPMATSIKTTENKPGQGK